VLVTGAYGLLGSWLVKTLVAEGGQTTVLRRDVVVASHLSLRAPNVYGVVYGGICDGQFMEQALSEYEVDPCFTWRLIRSSVSPTDRRWPPLRPTAVGSGRCLRPAGRATFAGAGSPRGPCLQGEVVPVLVEL
jgi:NAD dependent epimerase/dehydratase family